MEPRNRKEEVLSTLIGIFCVAWGFSLLFSNNKLTSLEDLSPFKTIPAFFEGNIITDLFTVKVDETVSKAAYKPVQKPAHKEVYKEIQRAKQTNYTAEKPQLREAYPVQEDAYEDEFLPDESVVHEGLVYKVYIGPYASVEQARIAKGIIREILRDVPLAIKRLGPSNYALLAGIYDDENAAECLLYEIQRQQHFPARIVVLSF